MRKGFTLIEVLITLAIVIAIGTVSYVNLIGRKSTANLTATTTQIGDLLRQAQSDSMTDAQGAEWGVHLDGTTSTMEYFSLFSSPNGTYASGTLSSKYSLPPGICYATSTVAVGSSTNIVFTAISGIPNASTTVILQLMSNSGCAAATSSAIAGGVARNSSGKIFFDNFSRSSL